MSNGTRIVGQIYPWDISDDPGRPAALLSAGIPEVAMAAGYHAVRAMNWAGSGRPEIINSQRSSFFLPVTEAAWRGARLFPTEPLGPEAGSFLRATTRARHEGLDVRAWIVLSHNDGDLARHFPDVATVDAWGTRSPYGLCISQPEVVDYCARLVQQTVITSGVRRLFVESVTPPGFTHSVAHDKTALSGLSEFDELLLSLCFCAACGARAEEDGWDPVALAAEVRIAMGDPRLEDSIAPQLEIHSRTRAITAARLCEVIASPVEGKAIEVTVAATAAPRSYSAYATLDAVPDRVTGLCTTFSLPGNQALRDLKRWADTSEILRAATVEIPDPSVTLAEALGEVDLSLVDELYLYHVGVRRPETLANLAIHDQQHAPGEK